MTFVNSARITEVMQWLQMNYMPYK